MKTKKEEKNMCILNTIPIFLAKTYKIVDVIIDIIDRTRNMIIQQVGVMMVRVLQQRIQISQRHKYFLNILNIVISHHLSDNQICMVFIKLKYKNKDMHSHMIHSRKIKCNCSVKGIYRLKLSQIKRKNTSTNDIQQPNESNMMVPLRRNQQTEFQKELNIVRNKHQDLQNFVSILVQQNKQILLQNRTFVNKMSKMQQKYKNKLQTLMLLLLFGKGKNNNGQPFILPPQFQNMLQSFNQNSNNKSYQLKQQGSKRKKTKIQQPLMLKNISQAQYQKNKYIDIDDKQKDQLGELIEELKNNKKQKIDDMEDSLGFAPPSPNHSFISFPELYDKNENGEVSSFFDKLQSNDFEDLSLVDQK